MFFFEKNHLKNWPKLKKMLFQLAVNPFLDALQPDLSLNNILHYLSHTKLLERLYKKKKLASENKSQQKNRKKNSKKFIHWNM